MRNERRDVHLLGGLIADASHCPEDVPFRGIADELHAVDAPRPARLPREMSYQLVSYSIQTCYSLPYATSRFGTPAVLFADCEGCLPLELHPVMNLWPAYHKLSAPSVIMFLLDAVMCYQQKHFRTFNLIIFIYIYIHSRG